MTIMQHRLKYATTGWRLVLLFWGLLLVMGALMPRVLLGINAVLPLQMAEEHSLEFDIKSLTDTTGGLIACKNDSDLYRIYTQRTENDKIIQAALAECRIFEPGTTFYPDYCNNFVPHYCKGRMIGYGQTKYYILGPKGIKHPETIRIIYNEPRS